MWRWLRRNSPHDAYPDAEAARDELLSAFLDGALMPDEARELNAQLEADAALHDALEGMREVKAALGTFEEVRAPRAFTLAAPPAEATSPGSRRLELGARFGAVAAAVALVVVLAGDLGTGSPSMDSQTTANSSAELAASGARLEGREQYAEAPGAAGEHGGSGAGPSGAAAGSTASDGAGGTPTTMLAPLVSATPGGAAGSAPAPVGPSATTVQQLTEPPAGQAAGDGTTDTQAPDVTAVPPEARLAAAPASSPAVDPDTPAVDGASDATQASNSDAAGAAGFAPVQPTSPPEVVAPEVGSSLRVSVEQNTGVDALRFTEAVLAVLVLGLGAAAGWLWYARRRAETGA